jgi:putative NADPH-quinone reductase
VANVGRAKAAMDQAQADLTRSEALARQGLVSPNQNETGRLNLRLRAQELESARQEENAARHELDQAQAARQQFAQAPLGGTQPSFAVRAPVSGKALKVLQQSEGILWCNHLVLFFPLWAGDMPALLKGMLEQVFRPAFTGTSRIPLAKKVLSGRSARVVVTMGMPALVYRWYFCGHSVKSLERNLLGMVGICSVKETLIGQTSDMPAASATQWLELLRDLGASGH